MVAIAVDDQEISLDVMKTQLERTGRFDQIHAFTSPQQAISFVKEHQVDIAFLDIVMEELDGITLANAISAYNPACLIVFTTSSKEFAFDAFQVHAFGYLAKPVTKEAVNDLMNRAEKTKQNTSAGKGNDSVPASGNASAPEEEEGDGRLHARCFGDFKVSGKDDQPFAFTYVKTKELLAYLIHRNGDLCTDDEIADSIFADEDDSPQLRKHIGSLEDDLDNVLDLQGLSDTVISESNGVAINPKLVECDYYDYLAGKNKDAFKGEYMKQYAWAQPMCEYLKKESKKKK